MRQRKKGTGEQLMAFFAARERVLVGLLMILAAMRVFVFSAAFPFFNNVDEPAHFDLVLKYSHGELPRNMAPYSNEALRCVALYNASFYLGSQSNDGESMPPPWKLPPEQGDLLIHAYEAGGFGINHESSQPPLYYALAGAWRRLGGMIGLDGLPRLYWLHFLNLPVIGALVWLGWMAARLVFPHEHFLRLGVPALLAFFPQSAFYSINNDVLSPVCFGVIFVCLIRLMNQEIPTIRLGLVSGLALAATFLVKQSNLPLLAISAMALFFIALQIWRSGKLRQAAPALSILVICAVVPAVLWMAWCEKYFGSLTGAKTKIALLGWTLKPFNEWWHHPIFTPAGCWIFLSDLLARFWQGEMAHHLQPLAFSAVNFFYVLATLVFLTVALTGLAPRSGAASVSQRRALWFSFFLFAGAVAFLGFLSTIYDFHDCFYPSSAKPYFTSGRLMLGALIPFCLLFMAGFGRALDWLKLNIQSKLLLLGVLLVFMLVSEIVTDWPVFFDEYNWFHL